MQQDMSSDMPTTIHVQYADASEAQIIAIYSAPQDPDVYPNQGEMPSDDVRYVAYYDAQYPQMQQWLIKPGE